LKKKHLVPCIAWALSGLRAFERTTRWR